MTAQIKVTKQYFPVVLFIVLFQVVLTFEFVGEILKMIIRMKATEQYFPMVLFIMLYMVVLIFEFVGKTPKCDRADKSY